MVESYTLQSHCHGSTDSCFLILLIISLSTVHRTYVYIHVYIDCLSFFLPDGAIFGYPVAKGAKCTKFTDGTVTCIPTNEETNLPFVCKMGMYQT